METLGRVLLSQGKFDEANNAHQQHLEIARFFRDRQGEGRAYFQLGNVYRDWVKKITPSMFPPTSRQTPDSVCSQRLIHTPVNLYELDEDELTF